MNAAEESSIQQAVEFHSLSYPVKCLYFGSPADSKINLTDAITGWTPETWRVSDVYKNGRKLPSDYWFTGNSSDGSQYLSLNVSGEVEVRYTKPHVLDRTQSTLRRDDEKPVAHLAAHFLFHILANHYAKKGQKSIGSDAVEFRRISGEYFMRAKDEKRIYKVHVGSRARPSSYRVDWDAKSQTGHRLIFRDGTLR